MRLGSNLLPRSTSPPRSAVREPSHGVNDQLLSDLSPFEADQTTPVSPRRKSASTLHDRGVDRDSQRLAPVSPPRPVSSVSDGLRGRRSSGAEAVAEAALARARASAARASALLRGDTHPPAPMRSSGPRSRSESATTAASASFVKKPARTTRSVSRAMELEAPPPRRSRSVPTSTAMEGHPRSRQVALAWLPPNSRARSTSRESTSRVRPAASKPPRTPSRSRTASVSESREGKRHEPSRSSSGRLRPASSSSNRPRSTRATDADSLTTEDLEVTARSAEEVTRQLATTSSHGSATLFQLSDDEDVEPRSASSRQSHVALSPPPPAPVPPSFPSAIETSRSAVRRAVPRPPWSHSSQSSHEEGNAEPRISKSHTRTGEGDVSSPEGQLGMRLGASGTVTAERLRQASRRGEADFAHALRELHRQLGTLDRGLRQLD